MREIAVKVHVFVNEPHIGAQDVIDAVIRVGGLQNVNMLRAIDFGIVTGFMCDPIRLVAIRAMAEVENVAVDRVKIMQHLHASAPSRPACTVNPPAKR